MTKQEAINKFNEEYQSALKKEIFPQHLLPSDFNEWKHAAFQFKSVTAFQVTYNLSWMEYKVLMMKQVNYSLMEIAVILNTIEERTPAELGPLVKANYYDIQGEVHKLNVEVKKIIDPLREQIQRKIEIMSAPGGQFNTQPLKFVKGNA